MLDVLVVIVTLAMISVSHEIYLQTVVVKNGRS